MTAKPRKPLLVNLTWVWVALLVLATLYTLSSGPALGVWAAIGEPDDLFGTLKTYYAPLDQAAEHSELFRSAILWYLSLWVDVGRSG